MDQTVYSMFGKLIEPELKQMIAQKEYKELREILLELDPGDIAESLQVLSDEETAIVFRILPYSTAADVFEHLEFSDQESLIHSLSNEHAAQLLDEMEPDDRTAFLEDLPGMVARQFISMLSPEERKTATRLLGYPEDSIARRATPEFVDIQENWTVAEALKHIRTIGKDKETINVVYVVDAKKKLVDDLRLRQLIFAEPDSLISDLMDRQFVALNAYDDQEHAIDIMSHYDRIALPVVERDGTLMGIVTYDDILDVVEEETTEDIHRLGGMEALDIPYSDASVWTMVQKRVGWLIILFIGGILTSVTLHQYEQALSQLTILMFFFPLIVSSGGNSGSQAATLVIRAMALQEVQLSDWYKVLVRELISGFFLGLTLGILACVILQFWTIEVDFLENVSAFQIILTVSVSVVGTVMIGTMVGAMLPFILRRFGLDPAMSSTPFVATLADITGVVVYFTIAQILLWKALS